MRVFYEKREYKIPILTYHSVGIPLNVWAWNYLSVPYKIFEKHIEALFRHGYRSMTLSELTERIIANREIPPKTIVLTFDDGYLDNWVFAVPILKKYGFKATFFIATDFIDPRNSIRKTLRETPIPTEIYGFLSWEEIRIMHEEGMDIQSHTATHTWYFKNNKIIDFRTPYDSYYWIDWNDNPSQKYCYLEKLIHKKRELNIWQPVYQFSESIITKRFFPDKNFDFSIMEYAKKIAKEKLNDIALLKAELLKHITKLRNEYNPVEAYETDRMYMNRIKNEIFSSKRLIESHIKEKVFLLCWPNGAYNKNALIIAQKAGFLGSTFSPKSERTEIFTESQLRFKRLYPPLYLTGNGCYNYRTGFSFILNVSLSKNTLTYKIYGLAMYLNNILKKLI